MFEKYARYYDLMYHNKDYDAECDLIEEIFNKFLMVMPQTILDVGCGTGGHLIPLIKRGYEVVGIDSSEEMVCKARQRTLKYKTALVFEEDIRDLCLDKKFDASICMFSVLNYITETDDLIKTLKNIREHLHPGGLFITDFWYGPAVLNIKPSVRVKRVVKDDIILSRVVRPEIDTFSHIVRSHYHIVVVVDDRVVDEFEEIHTLRYWFPQEMIWFLKQAGFKILSFSGFMDLNNTPTEDTWNAMIVAEVV